MGTQLAPIIFILFLYLFPTITICDDHLHPQNSKIITSQISKSDHHGLAQIKSDTSQLLEKHEQDKFYTEPVANLANPNKLSTLPGPRSEPSAVPGNAKALFAPRILMKRALKDPSGLRKIQLARRPKSTTTTTEISVDEEESEDADESEEAEAPEGSARDVEQEGDDKQKDAKGAGKQAVGGLERKPTANTKGNNKNNKPQQGSGANVNEKKNRKQPPSAGEQPNSGKGETKGEPNNGSSSNYNSSTSSAVAKSHKRKPIFAPSFIIPKNESACTPEAYLEFPRDLIGNKWRARGLVVIHLAVVCYMFYSLALVCERYFMPSLEEFAQRLRLSQDVAGATLMSAGSSAPELFTAILGVFVAKGDVGTGAIVGSAVFNILFVIGICAFVSTTTAQLNWWPVLRDSVFYTFTVLVLILFIYDERITAMESFSMMALYGVYILIMMYNEPIKEYVTKTLQAYPVTAKLFTYGPAASVDGPDDVFSSISSSINPGSARANQLGNYQTTSLTTMADQLTRVEDDSIFLAACLIIVRHKRLFRSTLRFQFAGRYIICKRQHRVQQQKLSSKQSNEVNYFGPECESFSPKARGPSSHQRERMEAYATTANLSKNKFSIVSKDDYEFWNRPPEEGENYYIWLLKIPVNYVLHYTVPDCTLYPDKYIITFVTSIFWTAIFSYIMVWMVTIIGYTFGIPDSVMGVTFLAAGTSVPDCYSSIHAARNGMADMAVSNSIGSNVFDILIGLSVPWFIQSAIYPGVVATINSRGVIYSVVLLFLSLIVTIYLMNKYEWTLKPRLGLALLIAYGLFIVLTCMLEFNLFGHVNPPPCIVK